MLRTSLILLALGLAASALCAQEKGYRIEHPDGTVEFTDQPAAGAKEITLPKAQSYEPPPTPPVSPVRPPLPPKGPAYSQLAIVTPAADETIHNGEAAVAVSVRLTPSLQEGHRLAILLDGKEVAAGVGTNFSLSEVERGSHTLVAVVRDAKGVAVQSSPPVVFHMRQFSRFFEPTPPNSTPSPLGPAPMMPKAPRMP